MGGPNRKHYKLAANSKLNKHKQGQLVTKTDQKALTREGVGEVDPFRCLKAHVAQFNDLQSVVRVVNR